jgi:hypothetical protein
VNDDLALFDSGGLARVLREWLMTQGVDVGDVLPSDPNVAFYASFIAMDVLGFGYLVRISPIDSGDLR